MHFNHHMLLDGLTEIVACCSILHTFLPPWDFLSDFPKLQKIYKAFVYVVGFLAISGRSTVYKTLSIKNAEGVNNYQVVKEEQQQNFVEKELKKQ